jgi:hypothetical protein
MNLSVAIQGGEGWRRFSGGGLWVFGIRALQPNLKSLVGFLLAY